ncbi:MAG: 23S rRNA (uracil(1939)-C(5))-methyltransferase RlmD [Clostridiales bacterium]|nr:23S rRNA (uracil(1939)-C(5))-methyltransferase RlmD [Clostridiales bacterium]
MSTSPQKNDVIRLNIEGMTSEGSAVGRHNSFTVFVPNGAIGDVIDCRIIKVKKNYAIGKIERIISPSPDRIESDCPVSFSCGGCTYRHIDYEAQLRIKRQMVEDAFRRIGGIQIDVNPVMPSPEINGYRNKAQFPVREENGEIKIGFFAPRSHRIIECGGICRLQPEQFGEIVNEVRSWMQEGKIKAYDESTGKGLVRHIYLRKGFATGEIMLCLVLNGNLKEKDKAQLIKRITEKHDSVKSICLNKNTRDTNVILGDDFELIYGEKAIGDRLGDLEIKLPPEVFYQINKEQAERLYKKAAELASLKGGETLMDLYCGTGTIGLFMIKEAMKESANTGSTPIKLIGVEVVEESVKTARENAKMNGINNTEFICATAEKAAEILLQRGDIPDVLVIDPPRKGCTPELIDTIAKMNPERIVYISCDCATLARDAAIFKEKGYALHTPTPVDMFPHTPHVECVTLMSRIEE